MLQVGCRIPGSHAIPRRRCVCYASIQRTRSCRSRPCNPHPAYAHIPRHHARHQQALQLAAAADDAPAEAESSDDPAPSEDDQRLEDSAEAALQLLGDMVEEVVRELFVDQGVAAVAAEEAVLKEDEVIQRAVASRLQAMDNSFLATLNGAIEMYAAENEDSLVELLTAIRFEVLTQVHDLLPAPIRVLNDLVQERERAARVELLKGAVWPSGRDAATVTVENLLVASSQLIADMEEQEQILDLRLLARLCLVREEVKEIEDEMYLAGVLTDKHMFQRSNVPQRCIAFLKELLAVGSQLQRVALLDKTFLEDWQGAAPKNSNMKFMAGEDRADLPDQVRPGRFLATMATAYQALVEQGQPGNAAVTKRMDDIKSEALAVLDKIQRS